MLVSRTRASASKRTTSKAPQRQTQRQTRTYATESRKEAVDKVGQVLQSAKEAAKKDESSRVFYQLFPDYASRAHESGVKELKDMFSAAVGAMEPWIAKSPSLLHTGAGARYRAAVSRWFAESQTNETPIKVAVTGASGAIGYALLFRIASGQMFGLRPIQLHLLEIPQAMNALKGVVMELQDAAFPLVRGIKAFDNAEAAFEDIDYACLVGAKPRTKGMERGDLLMANAEIFSAQGKALNRVAKKTVKVAVVGNPANTNAMIAQRNAPTIPSENFTAMTRLDHNRALAQISLKTGAHVKEVHQFAVWGNHSPTMYPSIAHALIGDKPAKDVLDAKWVDTTFIPEVQQRGAAIIAARGASSAASAGSALVDHVYDWVHGTAGEWTSLAVISKGEYGVEKGLCFSYPVVCNEGKWAIVEDLPLDKDSAARLEKTHAELKSERDGVAKLLP